MGRKQLALTEQKEREARDHHAALWDHRNKLALAVASTNRQVLQRLIDEYVCNHDLDQLLREVQDAFTSAQNWKAAPSPSDMAPFIWVTYREVTSGLGPLPKEANTMWSTGYLQTLSPAFAGFYRELRDDVSFVNSLVASSELVLLFGLPGTALPGGSASPSQTLTPPALESFQGYELSHPLADDARRKFFHAARLSAARLARRVEAKLAAEGDWCGASVLFLSEKRGVVFDLSSLDRSKPAYVYQLSTSVVHPVSGHRVTAKGGFLVAAKPLATTSA